MKMRRIKHALLFAISPLLFAGCFLDNNDEACVQFTDGEISCSTYHTLEICNSDGYNSLPNCHVAEYCTDYPTDEDSDTAKTETETSDDTETDSQVDSDSDTGNPPLRGRVCEKVCEGELVPCETMNKEQCRQAHHCEWYDVATM